MRNKIFTTLIGLVLILNVLGNRRTTTIATDQVKPNPESAAQFSPGYGARPLSFERNDGQTDPAVKFLARGANSTFFLTPTEAVLQLHDHAHGRETSHARTAATHPKNAAVLRMSLANADLNPRVTGVDQMTGASNYLDITDESKNVTEVPHFARVRYDGVYPGIDLVYYGNAGQLEYDFVVAPHADPSVIALNLNGADKLDLAADGSLEIKLGARSVRLGAPLVYQQFEGRRTEVAAAFHLNQEAVSFSLGDYDHSRELIIDPTLLYASYLGGNAADEASGIAVDNAGNAYVVGSTLSTNFPTVAGSLGVNDPDPATEDIFVTKVNPTGTTKIYSTYVGGVGVQSGHGIAVDSTGKVTIAGTSDAADPDGDALAVRLNAAGNSAAPANGGYVKIFGGTNDNSAEDVAVDAAGNAYLTGSTASVLGNTFPVVNAIQPAFSTGVYDSFLIKLDTGGNITYSTFLHLDRPGDYDEFGYGVALDPSGNIYVAGMVHSLCSPPCDNTSAFMMRINVATNAFAYNAPFGGSAFDRANDIAVDAAGNAYVTGTTTSTDFPIAGTPIQSTNGGNEDAFLFRVNSTGNITYSSCLGTPTSQMGNGIALDTAGNVYIAGRDSQIDPDGDAFILKLGTNGANYQLATGYSFKFGGTLTDEANDIAVDSAGNAYVAGYTVSNDFPDTPGVFQPVKGEGAAAGQDAFVAKVGNAVIANHTVADFDGDGKSDLSVFRPATGAWYNLLSGVNQTSAINWGSNGDRIVPGDYDGDGKTDLGVFRPSTGTWYVLRSTAGILTQSWGTTTDLPAAADYDGDGKTDVAVFRPATGTWYVLNSGNGSVRSEQFGANGDKPVIGDYDGDGKADLAVFRPSVATWYLLRSTGGFVGTQFGIATDQPAPGDFDGDGKTDLSVFRASSGSWYRLNSSNGAFVPVQWGTNGDRPAPGDFDGDGKADLSVFRPSNGSWYVLRSTGGVLSQQFGANGDVPGESGYLP
ncbi:MAG: SBBP repeat-containing protein [Pyrinomonadaceae bacterium]